MSLQTNADLDREIEEIEEIAVERGISFGEAMAAWNSGIRPGGQHKPWAYNDLPEGLAA